MAHEVFISYSQKNRATADAVCARLESEGIRCWIAPRDATPGMPFGESIIEAITHSRVMVLILSAESNASVQVMREVERAVNKGVVIIPLRIEDVTLTGSMEYFLSATHWLDAVTPPLERHLDELVKTINGALSGAAEVEPGRQPGRPLDLATFFLAGCGSGNSVALLPLPPGSDPEATSLTEFIDSLERIGVTGAALNPFLEARELASDTDAATEVVRGVVERYFSAMNSIDDEVRNLSSTEQFRWFKFGELLYGVALGYALEDEFPTAKAAALESLVEQMQLPGALQEQVGRLVADGRAGENPASLFDRANQVAQAAYSVL